MIENLSNDNYFGEIANKIFIKIKKVYLK